MEKTLNVQVEELKKSIVNAINNSDLHLFVIDAVLKELYNEVHMLYINQAKQEIKEYSEHISNEQQ